MHKTICSSEWINLYMGTLYPNTLNQKILAFHQGDIHQQRDAQKMVKKKMKLAKMQFNPLW